LFVEHPNPADLPPFLKGYRPDALALGKGKSIAIEVKLRRDSTMERSLKAMRERFQGQPQWEFRVVYGDEVEEEAIATPTPGEIEEQTSEAESLLAKNHTRAALVLGWAAIEGIARTINPDFPTSGLRTMLRALELLEHLGRLRFDQAQELRKLLPLRSKVVHGDFRTPITKAEVKPVLEAARTALSAA
jgi:hypothetical protein